MILTKLFELFTGFFDKIEPLEIDFISEFGTVLDIMIEHMISGLNLFVALVGSETALVISTYLSCIIALNLFYFGYQVVWWFIKKIPMLDIKQ